MIRKFYYLMSFFIFFILPFSSEISLADFMEIELIYIKGGCYQMGDTFGDGEYDETPLHKVCVKDFYLGKYEITQGQWTKIMGNNPSAFPSGNSHPVEWVSWNDTQQFLKTINRVTGETYRLPTEAEWEFAWRARGQNIKFGTQTGNLTPHLANYGSEKFGEGSALDGFEFTSPVGSYPPNQLGLYDMSGNVWEWVSDWKEINDNYYQRSPEENPQGAEKTRRKVGRGGSWNFSSRALRCSNRFSNWIQANCLSYGFRIAKDVIQ